VRGVLGSVKRYMIVLSSYGGKLFLRVPYWISTGTTDMIR
jgi:hypothetical protein